MKVKSDKRSINNRRIRQGTPTVNGGEVLENLWKVCLNTRIKAWRNDANRWQRWDREKVVIFITRAEDNHKLTAEQFHVNLSQILPQLTLLNNDDSIDSLWIRYWSRVATVLLLGRPTSKSSRLRRFKTDRDDIRQINKHRLAFRTFDMRHTFNMPAVTSFHAKCCHLVIARRPLHSIALLGLAAYAAASAGRPLAILSTVPDHLVHSYLLRLF